MLAEVESASLQSHDRDDRSLASAGLRPTRSVEDTTSLTSFNPFSEEDEHDQSGYALVTSLFSKVKTSLSNQLSSNKEPVTNAPTSPVPVVDKKFTISPRPSAPPSRPSLVSSSRPSSMTAPKAAPPLVSLTPVISELLRYDTGQDDDLMRPPSRGGVFYSPTLDSINSPDGGILYGTSIPGFPIQDDARSIRTSGSFSRSQPVSKVIRKIRGEGE
jgi:1-phosphatidylinositol-3-phosphate 5-kinase